MITMVSYLFFFFNLIKLWLLHLEQNSLIFQIFCDTSKKSKSLLNLTDELCSLWKILSLYSIKMCVNFFSLLRMGATSKHVQTCTPAFCRIFFRDHSKSRMEAKPFDCLLERQRIDGLKLFVKWCTAYNCMYWYFYPEWLAMSNLS